MTTESILLVKVIGKISDTYFGQEHTLCSPPSWKYWQLVDKGLFFTICVRVSSAFAFS